MEYGIFVPEVDPTNNNSYDSNCERYCGDKWRKIYGEGLTSLLGVGKKSNKLIVKFESDLAGIDERREFLEKSYIASIGRKSGGHKHKEIIQVILRKSFPQNKLEKVEKEYSEYQIAKRTADGRRMEKFQKNPEVYTPILSFTRYLANMSRKQRRERGDTRRLKKVHLQHQRSIVNFVFTI